MFLYGLVPIIFSIATFLMRERLLDYLEKLMKEIKPQ